MKRYIVIDGGTTNTRFYLLENDILVDSLKISLGARNCIDSNNEYRTLIRENIERLLRENSYSYDDLTALIASGMITSELGLYKLEHIAAPAGAEELHNGIVKVVLSDVCDMPFNFIPGVKFVSEDAAKSDMMRGEETELMGLVDSFPQNSLYVLPGSHSKLIMLDDKNKITSFMTTLTGEMIFALSNSTILKDSLNLKESELSEEWLVKGYECAEEFGINGALFKVRTLKKLCSLSTDGVYSFYMGVILHDEIKIIISSQARNVCVAGREQIKKATALLLRNFSDKSVVEVGREQSELSVPKGAIKIFEYKNKAE